MQKILILCLLLLSACAPAATQPADVSLQPYLTSTPAPTSTPNIFVEVNTPVPTTTPQIYIIQSGDTLSQIAEKFKISQSDLMAANPNINPNILSIGQTLIIPDSSASPAASTPTPIPVPITQGACHPTADSGLWCFALVQNNTAGVIENVSAQINLLDENNTVIASQPAFALLDVISANSSLPVYVFFPNITANVQPQIQLLTAMQGSASSYLPAELHNTAAQIDQDGRTAQISGEVYLPPESNAATQVWIAAVAYDKNGTVVGARRFEGGAIQPGSTTPFEFQVSSIGGVIEAVEFFVEAR